MRFQTAVISGWIRRALLRRLKQSSLPSGLFYPVCLAFTGGLFAAIDVGSEAPGFALDSVWLYRAEVGLAFMGAIYLAGVILWLAWHGRGFFELGAFGLTLKAGEAEKIEAAAVDVSQVVEELVRSQVESGVGLEEIEERLSALEDQAVS